jgi:3-hydroxyisobutyrate dehydrogenase-like beta-hydroxyacid dehydrogenase
MATRMSLRIALIGFGEVGQMLAAELLARGARVAAWDLKFADAGSEPAKAAAKLGITAARDAASAADADLLISAVTAAQTGPAAQSVAPHVAPGTWYFDMNSCSPATRSSTGVLLEARGVRFVEAAVMSPIAPLGAGSPMLIGGEHAAAFKPLAESLGFARLQLMPGKLGSASAAKMCRSVLVKGLEALVLESLLSARRHGVEEAVLDSLRALKVDDWRESALYMASRALTHGARRAEEMREAARTVREAGLTPHMSAACALWQDWAAAHPQLSAAELPQLLDGLLVGQRAPA